MVQYMLHNVLIVSDFFELLVIFRNQNKPIQSTNPKTYWLKPPPKPENSHLLVVEIKMDLSIGRVHCYTGFCETVESDLYSN